MILQQIAWQRQGQNDLHNYLHWLYAIFRILPNNQQNNLTTFFSGFNKMKHIAYIQVINRKGKIAKTVTIYSDCSLTLKKGVIHWLASAYCAHMSQNGYSFNASGV